MIYPHSKTDAPFFSVGLVSPTAFPFQSAKSRHFSTPPVRFPKRKLLFLRGIYQSLYEKGLHSKRHALGRDACMLEGKKFH